MITLAILATLILGGIALGHFFFVNSDGDDA